MALFGSQRDVSLIRNINRELLGDIITQQIAYYKLVLDRSTVNIYGESPSSKFYKNPVLLNCLIERNDQIHTEDDKGIDFNWLVKYSFFRDDLVEANVVPEIGDIIMYYEGYYEVDNVVTNQLFAGKDPAYPYNVNPLNPGLENFGSNISIICATHYVPADKVSITLERL
jgi:hypothetical protein